MDSVIKEEMVDIELPLDFIPAVEYNAAEPLDSIAVIDLSSGSDSDSDDEDGGGCMVREKKPMVLDGGVEDGGRHLKKRKSEDVAGIGLPLGFLDPLPPEEQQAPPLPPLILVTQHPLRVMNNCKQFWKAGDYGGDAPVEPSSLSAGMDRVRVHPKFLHSNATSHKWALGALAELLDNAFDEVCNGATFVNIDMLENQKDMTRMLLVEDNGGGMDPDKMRQCMSLGYSAKSKVANTIGQYGNGFKTSTMRLGADVIVFSRSRGKGGKSSTQSIGMLSYTFLRSTGKEDIIVPMLDYEKGGGNWNKLLRSSSVDWNRNLETIVQWSPYRSETDLLHQFSSMTDQGTRVVIFNLWEDDQGELELDFDADKYDIQIRGVNRDEKMIQMAKRFPNSRHFLTYRHSLRSYASILYLRLPQGFKIILRGKEIEHHNIVNDMMLKQEITYKPQSFGDGAPRDQNMVAVVTIGFVKDAKDHIDVQGFNVYHKNRLIKPFWRVWKAAGSDGRGVIGVLEANFVEPAHDKQGFERTTVLSRLEARLIQMQRNYWRTEAHKIGYAPRVKEKLLDSIKDREILPEVSPNSKTASVGKSHDSTRLQSSTGKSFLSSQTELLPEVSPNSKTASVSKSHDSTRLQSSTRKSSLSCQAEILPEASPNSKTAPVSKSHDSTRLQSSTRKSSLSCQEEILPEASPNSKTASVGKSHDSTQLQSSTRKSSLSCQEDMLPEVSPNSKTASVSKSHDSTQLQSSTRKGSPSCQEENLPEVSPISKTASVSKSHDLTRPQSSPRKSSLSCQTENLPEVSPTSKTAAVSKSHDSTQTRKSFLSPVESTRVEDAKLVNGHISSARDNGFKSGQKSGEKLSSSLLIVCEKSHESNGSDLDSDCVPNERILNASGASRLSEASNGRITTRSCTKEAGVACNGNQPNFQKSDILTLELLKFENCELNDRLKQVEDETVSLTEKLEETEKKLGKVNKEQEALIDIFSDERSRRDKEEENLRTKLKGASIMIQELLGKLNSNGNNEG